MQGGGDYVGVVRLFGVKCVDHLHCLSFRRRCGSAVLFRGKAALSATGETSG